MLISDTFTETDTTQVSFKHCPSVNQLPNFFVDGRKVGQ